MEYLCTQVAQQTRGNEFLRRTTRHQPFGHSQVFVCLLSAMKNKTVGRQWAHLKVISAALLPPVGLRARGRLPPGACIGVGHSQVPSHISVFFLLLLDARRIVNDKYIYADP